MAVPLEQFVRQLEDSGILAGDTLKSFLPPNKAPSDGAELARELVRQKKLSRFQAEEIYRGNGKSLVLGNYTVLDKIGAGGMGEVFKAEHRRMRRIVAIKILPAGLMRDPAVVARFEREVRAAAQLNHPNIVTAFDADNANGVHLLVMEYVDGQDLSAIVKKNGPLPVESAVQCILQAARGLEAAHEAGIVHRDIKPANLLLDANGTVKILDMGVARLGDQATKADLTSTGMIMGTVDYMAPEQALNTKTADARADIYSLGCSLFYILMGKATYGGDSLMAKLLAHREQPIPSLREIRSDVPPAVDAVFQRMVAKQVADRYQSIKQVIADLEACLSGRAPAVQPPALLAPSRESSIDEGLTNFLRESTLSPTARVVASKPGSAAAPRKKEMKRWLIGGGLVAALLLTGLVFGLRPGREKPAAPAKDQERQQASAVKSSADDDDETETSAESRMLSEMALVTSPARLPEIKTWSILPAANRVAFADRNISLASNSKATLLAVPNEDGGTRIFDVTTGKLLRIIVSPGAVTLAALSPDGKLLATGGQGNRVWLWDAATARRIRAIEAQATLLAWSPKEPVLAVGTPHDVQFFDSQGDRCRSSVSMTSLCSVSWAPDGDRIAIANYFGTIDVRQTSTGKSVSTWASSEKQGTLRVAWSPSSEALASGMPQEDVRIWDPRTGKALRTLVETASAPGCDHCLTWSAFRDELTVASTRKVSSERFLVQTFAGDAATPRNFDVPSLLSLRDIARSHDGRWLVMLIGHGLVYMHDTTAPARSRLSGHTFSLNSLVLSESGNAVAFASKVATNSTWGSQRVMTLGLERDWKTGFRNLEREYSIGFDKQLAFVSRGSENLLAVAESYDGKNTLELWRGFNNIFTIDLPRPVRYLAASPDGRRLAVGLDKHLAIVDVAEAKIVQELPEHVSQVVQIAWGPQGGLAAGYADGTLRIWKSDLADFVAATPFGSNPTAIKRVAWSPDGKQLAAIQFGAREIALIDATGTGSTGTESTGTGAAGTIFTGEEPGNLVWPDNTTIVARMATSLKKWPIADFLSYSNLYEAPCHWAMAEFSPRCRLIAERISTADYRFRDGATGQILGTLLMVQDCRPVVISPDGHYSSPVDVESELVYVVETDDGQQKTYTPAEFSSRFRWTNDPERAFPLRLKPPN